jgi:chromosome segregation ATPase
MKMFSEKKKTRPGLPDLPSGIELPQGEDRLTQAFQLLFGVDLGRFRQELERMETEVVERLERLQKDSLRHERQIEGLLDKANAGLERERSEQERRKAAETELGRNVADLRNALGASVRELRDQAEKIETGVGEQLETERHARQASHAELQQEVATRLEQALAALHADKVDRAELAAVLADAARALGHVG